MRFRCLFIITTWFLMLALSRCFHSMEATELTSLSCLWDSSCHIQGCLCPPQGCRATSTHYKRLPDRILLTKIQFWQGLNVHTWEHKVDASSFCMFLCLLFVCLYHFHSMDADLCLRSTHPHQFMSLHVKPQEYVVIAMAATTTPCRLRTHQSYGTRDL